MRTFKVSLALLISLLALTTTLAAPGAGPQADPVCPNGICTVMLPIVSYSTLAAPLTPLDGEQIATLAPIMSWAPFKGGVHRIQVTTDQTFSPTSSMAVSTTKSIKQLPAGPVTLLVTSNLKPATTYFWRIGTPTDQGYVYSNTHSFTTPAKNDSALPPPPRLSTPGNKTRLRSNSVLLQWQPVPGAIYYRVRMYDANEELYDPGSDEVAAPITSFQVDNLPPKTTFHWRVKALNSYGWGDFPADYYFTTP